MSEPQPSKGAETNAGHQPASAGFESLVAVGARLAQLREAKGWSVDDVSARLKVAPPKLRALEAGDISHLPGTTFALGVVRSYAKMLGVDPEPFAQALRREKGVPELDLSMPASAGTDLPRGRVSIPLGGSSRQRSWLWAIAAVVVAVIAVAMWHTGGESPNWLARFTSVGATGASGVPATPEAASEAAASAATAGAAPVAEAASSASAVAPASAVVAPAPAVMASAATATGIVVTPGAAAASAAASPASGASAALAEGQSVVELTVKQDCWFGVRDKNGKALFSALLRAGDTKQVVGAAPFKVTIGNTAGLDAISFDGKPVDPAKYSAARGNVARFALP